jgi:hypothetical protein
MQRWANANHVICPTLDIGSSLPVKASSGRTSRSKFCRTPSRSSLISRLSARLKFAAIWPTCGLNCSVAIFISINSLRTPSLHSNSGLMLSCHDSLHVMEITSRVNSGVGREVQARGGGRKQCCRQEQNPSSGASSGDSCVSTQRSSTESHSYQDLATGPVDWEFRKCRR